ncbi:MAG: carbamoyl-phosphate synthase large subunit, partial [Acidimicrobiia bacterium]|nr:carbamoyl-phosphate synthase large subunit [Acidimicrobiia bacterium]
MTDSAVEPRPIRRLLIANRGEVAVRIARAASDLDIETVGVFSTDDAGSLHNQVVDRAVGLDGRGVAAYLDIDGVVGVARNEGCDAIHPGYGFLAENPELARRCGVEGLLFVGPTVDNLELFGDKTRARAAASAAGLPVLAGIDRAVSLDEARAFFLELPAGSAMMVKAIAGGGGRGTRAVHDLAELDATYERCRSEAAAAFGVADLYVEQLVDHARHIEVQLAGDHAGTVAHLGERECSVQRRYQKIVEIAPALNLDDDLRDRLHDAAVRLGSSVDYRNLGTIEFLVADGAGQQGFAFIEANARLQVEHTVTEEVTGVDLVQTQIRLAEGAALADLGVDGGRAGQPRGYAIQARVNLETMEADGSVRPTSGTLTAYEAPSGPGVRTDGFGYTGYETSVSFDSLLAKVITHSASPDFGRAVNRTTRALTEFRVEGVATNIDFLLAVLARPELTAGEIHTRFIDDHMAELVSAIGQHRRRHATGAGGSGSKPEAGAGLAGAQVDTSDPLALFAHDQAVKSTATDEAGVGAPDLSGPEGSIGVPVPIQGTIVSVAVGEGDQVREGTTLAVMEAMKMEHVIAADRTGVVTSVGCLV